MLGAVVGGWAGGLSAGAEDFAGKGAGEVAGVEVLARGGVAAADRCVDGVAAGDADLAAAVGAAVCAGVADLPGIAWA